MFCVSNDSNFEKRNSFMFCVSNDLNYKKEFLFIPCIKWFEL